MTTLFRDNYLDIHRYGPRCGRSAKEPQNNSLEQTARILNEGAAAQLNCYADFALLDNGIG